MSSEGKVTWIIRKIMDAEEEKGTSLDFEEASEIIGLDEDKTKQILNLLDEMELIERGVRTTEFARSISHLPTEEPEEVKKMVEERTEDLQEKVGTLQESVLQERAEREIKKAKDQLDSIVKTSEAGDYNRALTLMPAAYKYLADALETIMSTLPF